MRYQCACINSEKIPKAAGLDSSTNQILSADKGCEQSGVLATGDTFDNVIFSDECSISLEQFRRTCYRKVGKPAKRKTKPKHLESTCVGWNKQTRQNEDLYL